jgi:hypothetical protein
MDKNQLRNLIHVVLKEIGLYSEDAVELLMLTAATESNLGYYIVQKGGGPALGIFQMEPDTEDDIWENYLQYKDTLADKISKEFPIHSDFSLDDLEFNLGYQIAMARIHYLRVPEKLPSKKDTHAMALYWKRYYNTYLGKGTTEKAIGKYERYCL